MLDVAQRRLLTIERSLNDVALCVDGFEREVIADPKTFYVNDGTTRILAAIDKMRELSSRLDRLVRT